jgi:hypothetical protein
MEPLARSAEGEWPCRIPCDTRKFHAPRSLPATSTRWHLVCCTPWVERHASPYLPQGSPATPSFGTTLASPHMPTPEVVRRAGAQPRETDAPRRNACKVQISRQPSAFTSPLYSWPWHSLRSPLAATSTSDLAGSTYRLEPTPLARRLQTTRRQRQTPKPSPQRPSPPPAQPPPQPTPLPMPPSRPQRVSRPTRNRRTPNSFRHSKHPARQG